MNAAEIVLGLVVVAVAVAAVAGRLQAPAPSLLVIAGILIGLIPGTPSVTVSPAVIASIVLPPLVFAAAQDVAVSELRKVAVEVAVLAVGLVAASTVAVGLALHAIAPQTGIRPDLAVGAALASTDPVAVSALARRLHLPPRLLALVQGESLFNDATSLVLFSVAISITVEGGPVDVPGAILDFVRLAAGGAAVGAVAAFLAVQLHRRTTDSVLDVTISLVTPYAAFVGAESLGCSGVTAVVVAGLGISVRRLTLYDGRTRLIVDDLYEVLVFLLESAVFAVIGLALPQLARALPPGARHVAAAVLVVTAVMLGIRIVWVFAVTYLSARRRRGSGESRLERRILWQGPLVVTWSGARGVVPLTAGLSIPLTVDSGAPYPQRDLLLLVISACVVITLVVQGFTLAPLVRRFNLLVPRSERQEHERRARAAVAAAALAWLDGVDGEDPDVVAVLRMQYARRAERAGREANEDVQRARDRSADIARLRGEVIAVQSAELLRLREQGRISESARRRVQRSLDVEETALLDRT